MKQACSRAECENQFETSYGFLYLRDPERHGALRWAYCSRSCLESDQEDYAAEITGFCLNRTETEDLVTELVANTAQLRELNERLRAAHATAQQLLDKLGKTALLGSLLGKLGGAR
jgi:hypothetical protein